ncbi:conserved hypothetical protein [Klebsiella quasipneumoniae subsp. similipneumoniae]|nr:conserved hypothetical protein [Klebsiella quasipneumoniae subsp. similipneumoniae]
MHSCEAGHCFTAALLCLHHIRWRWRLVVINMVRDNQKQCGNPKNNPANKFYNTSKNSRHNTSISFEHSGKCYSMVSRSQGVSV